MSGSIVALRLAKLGPLTEPIRIGYFQVTLCLSFKTSLCAKSFIDLHENNPVGGTHVHGFAWRLILTEATGDSEKAHSPLQRGPVPLYNKRAYE